MSDCGYMNQFVRWKVGTNQKYTCSYSLYIKLKNMEPRKKYCFKIYLGPVRWFQMTRVWCPRPTWWKERTDSSVLSSALCGEEEGLLVRFLLLWGDTMTLKKTFNSGGLLTVQGVWWHVGRGSNRHPTEDVVQIKGVLSSFKVWLKGTCHPV